MSRRIRIHTKLAAVIAVPLLALVTFAAVEVFGSSGAADSARAEAQMATATVGPGSFLINLQNERNRASIDLIGLGKATTLPVDSNAQARPLTDASLTDLRAELAGQGEEVTQAFAPAFAALDDLSKLRNDIDSYTGPQDLTNSTFANDVFTRYTTMTEAFFDAVSSTALSVDDADLRNGVEIIDASARQSEMRARSVREVVLASLTGTINTAEVHQNVAALNDRASNLDDAIRTHATGPYAGIADATFADPGVRSFNEQVNGYLAGGTPDIIKMLDAVRTTPETGYTGLRTRAANTVTAQAERIVNDAEQRQRLFLGGAMLIIALAVLVTWLVSRSITRPLLSLREQAEDMAEHRLPDALKQILDTPMGEDVRLPTVEPVTVKTRDEVREVAAALNTVQKKAVDLAVEQAVLRRNISDSYVNLGRRNQNLLDRQLEFITELEASETEPDALDELFRLDHLATRMRRNAESLLVLANVEVPRQPSAPVVIDDIVRAACGEVEDYKRVLVRALDRVALQGSAAPDAAHVLAEVIENALTFSPPASWVEVKGRLTSTDYSLAVIDDGVGMSADDIDAANRRLAGTESFTVAPSKYLGHYVAGHLASRHGIHVELQAGPAGGTIAKIVLPLALLTDEPVPEPFVPSVATPVAAPAEQEIFVSADEPSDAPVLEPAMPAVWNSESTPRTTPNGLPRRVAGAQLPDTPALAARLAVLDDEPAPEGSGGPPPDDQFDDDASKTNADEVYAFLSNFASGVERGRADASTPADEEG